MKLCLAFLSLLLPLAAHSQTAGVCAGISASGPTTITEAAPTWAALPCLPALLGGTGQGYNTRIGAGGGTAWLWCPSGTGWSLRWGAATWADIAPVVPELTGALIASDRLTALRQFGWTHLSRDVFDPDLKALWCPHWAAMIASRPTAQAWRVVKAPSNANPTGTRAIFDFTPATPTTAAAFRSTAERVRELTLCDCSDTWSNSTSTYCRVPATPAVRRPMALCSRAP